MELLLLGVVSIFVAYLIGGIPTAFLITRFRTGKDIRTLGSGNVGANNVYVNVGLPWAVITGIIDVLKGMLAVVAAQMLILQTVGTGVKIPTQIALLYIMGAALAAVIGHIWPVYLKFKGGNGIATTLGILLMIMTREVLIAILVALVIVAITRNPILSINISLLGTIPIAGGLLPKPYPWYIYVGFALVLIAILVLNFIPTMKKAMATAGSKEKLTAELMRIEPKEPPKPVRSKTAGANKRKKRPRR